MPRDLAIPVAYLWGCGGVGVWGGALHHAPFGLIFYVSIAPPHGNLGYPFDRYATRQFTGAFDT